MRSVRPCPYDRIHHTQVALGMKCSPTVVVVVVVVLLLNYIYASNTCICCTTLTLCGIVFAYRSSKPDQIFVDCSTISPESSKKVSEMAERKGCKFLGAPVSGGT